MLQEFIALFVILIFMLRLSWQFHKGQLPRAQFIFWLLFWVVGGVLVLYLRSIDALAARLGFSSSGIEILLYLAVAVIFYYIFRLRLKIASLEKDLTVVIRSLALNSARRHGKDEAPADDAKS